MTSTNKTSHNGRQPETALTPETERSVKEAESL
jgi:hypothetical protein